LTREWTHPSVALVAPGCVFRYPSSATGFDGDSTVGSPLCGTSMAAPMVAGSAALLIHAFESAGYPGATQTGARLLPNMMLMGNGWWTTWDGDLDEVYGGEQTSPSQWPSPGSGFGKLRMHYPGSGDPTMGSTSTWKWNPSIVKTVAEGFNTSWPANPNSSGNNVAFPANATQFKWASAYYPSDMNDYGSLGMEVWEASCSTSNPLSGTMRAYDWSTSSRKRIQMFASDIANKCLWLVIKAYSTPGQPGANVEVINATYYHSGNTDLH
jgi:hypothetical protein